MAKVLITGGAGFIGSALVRHVLKRGDEACVLIRKKTDLSNIEGLSVAVHYGNIYHQESLQKAMRDVDIVFHTAAVYKFYPWWKKRSRAIYKVNIDGTKNVVNCAKQANVKQFVFTSSIITIGKNAGDQLANEQTPFLEQQLTSHYSRSKFEAESFILEEAKKGFPAVIVNPGMVMGQRDGKPTPTGEVILKFLNKIYPGYFDTIWCVADVDDVAKGHIAAAEKGRVGERYILCNKKHYSMKQIFKILQQISGVRSPFIKFPFPLLKAFIYADEWSIQLIKHKPLLPTEGVKFCRTFLRCDNTKAAAELGYTETPFEETLEKAVRWYRDNGYVKR